MANVVAEIAPVGYCRAMSSRAHIKTKYEGVFYRESTVRKPGQPVDRTYAVCYRDAAGKLCWHTVGRHSTGIRAAYASQVRRALLEEVAAGKNPGQIRSYTVGEAVDAYLAWATGEGKRTGPDLNRYDIHLRAALHAVPVAAVTPQMLTDLKKRLGQTLGDQSLRHCFGLLRRAVNHVCDAHGLAISNPFAVRRGGSFQLPRAENAAVRFLTPEEAHSLLGKLKTRRAMQVHDMALLSLKTGMRATEIFSIQGQGLDDAASLIHFRAKGGAMQHVHAPASILAKLRAYNRAPGEFIFQSRAGGPLRWGISETFDRAAIACHLNDGITDSRRKVRFHTMRHTFASWLAQSGQVTLQELMELLRHERIEMTLRYAHLIPGHQRDKLRIIDELLDDHDD